MIVYDEYANRVIFLSAHVSGPPTGNAALHAGSRKIQKPIGWEQRQISAFRFRARWIFPRLPTLLLLSCASLSVRIQASLHFRRTRSHRLLRREERCHRHRRAQSPNRLRWRVRVRLRWVPGRWVTGRWLLLGAAVAGVLQSRR